MKEIEPFYVLNWDINQNDLKYLDIMPYFLRNWEEDKRRKYKIWCSVDKIGQVTKMPETFEEFEEFVFNVSRYTFMSRCEYEIIISDWPNQMKHIKVDVFQQIKMNLDLITKHFMNQIKK